MIRGPDPYRLAQKPFLSIGGGMRPTLCKVKLKSSMVRSLPVENLLPPYVGQLSTTCTCSASSCSRPQPATDYQGYNKVSEVLKKHLCFELQNLEFALSRKKITVQFCVIMVVRKLYNQQRNKSGRCVLNG